jgi:glycosyltransferase involved in cell wall biosynthesis
MKALFVPEYSNKGNPYQRILADSLSKKGVDVNFGATSSLFSVLRSLKNYWKPDILHIHWTTPFLFANSRIKTVIKSVGFIFGLLILKLSGIKIVWTAHNVVNHEVKFISLEPFFTRLMVELCDKVIVHSPSAKNEIIKGYGFRTGQIAIIPHGSYINYYKNVIDRAQARERLQVGGDDVVFLYFGQVRPYKGVPELINAFKGLDCPQAKLFIVGEPLTFEIASDILRKCNGDGRIRTVLEFIPDDEIQIYMNAADIMVLPYRCVLTSGAAMLGMSFSKPVIAPSIGGMSDILDSKGGFLYDPLQKDSLAKAMEQALTSELKKMGEHNLELSKRLSWDEIAQLTYDNYQECFKRED